MGVAPVSQHDVNGNIVTSTSDPIINNNGQAMQNHMQKTITQPSNVSNVLNGGYPQGFSAEQPQPNTSAEDQLRNSYLNSLQANYGQTFAGNQIGNPNMAPLSSAPQMQLAPITPIAPISK